MKNLIIALICLVSPALFAHNNHEHAQLKQWFMAKDNKTIDASFMMMKDKTVYLEDENQHISEFPLSALTLNDQLYVIQKYKQIEKFNSTPSVKRDINWQSLIKYNFWLLIWFSSLLMIFLLIKMYQNRLNLKYAYTLVSMGIMSIFISFMPPAILGTDPNFIDSAFIPFKPKVKTRWDATYFYVENLGFPSHQMMVGITAWQQQFPIPQCYVGTNAWSIPLNPVVAATPTPTKTNFFKGAVAIAANGIPIFNALNNRGEDAYLIGELDKFGGHCGRADDYHYHIAPLSLDSISTDILPIAFALDGFAVYGSQEPNGLIMNTLDANHGHYLNGVYHYHATLTYPYVVGNMVGVVTKDATDQIIPQAQAKPIRPAGNPLNGATITDNQAVGTNGFNLTYKLNNQNYNVNYSWTNAGAFTFNFVSPTGTTTSNYTGQICTLSTALNEFNKPILQVKVFPNPIKNSLIQFEISDNSKDLIVKIVNNEGRVLINRRYKAHQYDTLISINAFDLNTGFYWLSLESGETKIGKKILVLRD